MTAHRAAVMLTGDADRATELVGRAVRAAPGGEQDAVVAAVVRGYLRHARRPEVVVGGSRQDPVEVLRSLTPRERAATVLRLALGWDVASTARAVGVRAGRVPSLVAGVPGIERALEAVADQRSPDDDDLRAALAELTDLAPARALPEEPAGPAGAGGPDGPGGPDGRGAPVTRSGGTEHLVRHRRLLTALVGLVVLGLLAWSLSAGSGAGTARTDPDTSAAPSVGPDASALDIELDEGEPPSGVMGMTRTVEAEVTAGVRTTSFELGDADREQSMQLARFGVLWCDMPPAASRGIEVPRGVVTVGEDRIEVPCAGRDGSPPVSALTPLPLQGVAVLEVTGDLPPRGRASLAVYTERGDPFGGPLVRDTEVPVPPAPPGAVVLGPQDGVPAQAGLAEQAVVVEIGSDSTLQLHARQAGSVSVRVDDVAVTDDGDIEAWASMWGPSEEMSTGGPPDAWRTQQADLRMGRWVAYTPGAQRTFPIPDDLRPRGSERRTVTVSASSEDSPVPVQVVVTGAEVAPPDPAAASPVPPDQLPPDLPRQAQGRRVAQAWSVPQDGMPHELPGAPTGRGTIFVALASPTDRALLLDPGSWSGGLVTSEGITNLGLAAEAGLVVDLLTPTPWGNWVEPVEERLRPAAGTVAARLPTRPGHGRATVVAYTRVDYEDFDFEAAPPPFASWPAGESPDDWTSSGWMPSGSGAVQATITEDDLKDGEADVEIDSSNSVLWITTRGPGRMRLTMGGEPAAGEVELTPSGLPVDGEGGQGWWSSWTSEPVTTEVPLYTTPLPSQTLHVEVEGYDEDGFRLEVREMR